MVSDHATSISFELLRSEFGKDCRPGNGQLAETAPSDVR